MIEQILLNFHKPLAKYSSSQDGLELDVISVVFQHGDMHNNTVHRYELRKISARYAEIICWHAKAARIHSGMNDSFFSCGSYHTESVAVYPSTPPNWKRRTKSKCQEPAEATESNFPNSLKPSRLVTTVCVVFVQA